MYAVPKEKYDAFIAGACKGDIKYTRQINQLDVNDGGKVIIRNDDNIKNSTVTRQKTPPPNSPKRKVPSSTHNFDRGVYRGNKRDDDSSNSSSDSSDFLTNVNSRIEALKKRFLSSNSVRDGTDVSPNEREDGHAQINSQENPFIPNENDGNFSDEENPFIPPPESHDSANRSSKKSHAENSPTVQIPRSIENPSGVFTPNNEVRSSVKSHSENLPSVQIPQSISFMPVTSENPPRVFTPINELYSNAQLPGIAQVLNAGRLNSNSINPLSANGSIPVINLNALPDDFFNQSPIRDLKDLKDWSPSSDNLKNDIFDVSMEDLDSSPNSPKKSGRKDHVFKMRSNDGVFKRPSQKAKRDRQALRNIIKSRPLKSRISSERNSPMQIASSQNIPAISYSSDQSEGMIEPVDQLESVEMLESPNKPRKARKFAEKKEPTERQLTRSARQSVFDARRGPRSGQDFDAITSMIARYPPLPAMQSFEIPPNAGIPIPQPQPQELKYLMEMPKVVRNVRRSRKRSPDSERRKLRSDKHSAYDERRAPRGSRRNLEDSSDEERRSPLRKNDSNENFPIVPYANSTRTRLGKKASDQITSNSSKVQVKIGKPAVEIVNIVRKKKKSDRKRDHSPELQARFSKNKNPEKRKKDGSSEEDSDDDYKMWNV